MSIDKHFHGHLQAVSSGETLAAMTETEGPAGCVAIERVDGTLPGLKGRSFLQHNGIMNRGASELTITVIADSATGELTGLPGVMTTEIESGQHFYELTRSLPSR